MVLFIKELIKRLDVDMPDWRSKMVWSHDGARYFNNDAIKSVLKNYKVPVMVSAPHSYNVAPCELVFAAIKRTHMNLD